jgi:hypothetical protein
MFTKWITYPLLLVSDNLQPNLGRPGIESFPQVLMSTGVGQIRYLNRALMRFDSKVWIMKLSVA